MYFRSIQGMHLLHAAATFETAGLQGPFAECLRGVIWGLNFLKLMGISYLHA
jgi:hypothetical protein